MPSETPQPEESVVLRVVANSEFNLRLGNTLKGASSEELAKEGAKSAAGTGAGLALNLCNPLIGIGWILTCPAGVVVGAGVAVGGSVGAGIHGGAAAWSRTDIDMAKATWDRTKRNTILADELRDRLIETLHKSTSTRVLEAETGAEATGQPTDDSTSTVVLAVDIEDFFVSEVGEASPNLWLDFKVSGALYEFPDTRPLYIGGWYLHANLGDYYELINSGGLGLRSRMDAAFEKMAVAIANDLFTIEKPIALDGDYQPDGEVITSYAAVPTVSCVKFPGTLSSYLLYLEENGIADTDRKSSKPAAEDFSAMLAALNLSLERGELSNEEYMQKQREIVSAYTGRTGADSPQMTVRGRPVWQELQRGCVLRVAILPFAAEGPGSNSQVERDLLGFAGEFLISRGGLEMTYSYYQPENSVPATLDPGALWEGIIRKLPRKSKVYALADKLDVEVALTYLYSPRRSGGSASDLYSVEVYVFDLEYERMYHERGHERNFKRVTEQLFRQLIRDRRRSAGIGS